jgi:hypothetical protein
MKVGDWVIVRQAPNTSEYHYGIHPRAWAKANGQKFQVSKIRPASGGVILKIPNTPETCDWLGYSWPRDSIHRAEMHAAEVF